jgi:hypothetical protein
VVDDVENIPLPSDDPKPDPNNALVVAFNGETVDIRTRRPLSNVPRHELTIPLDSSDPLRLLSVAVDEYVFNSYYDAWYNRGIQAQKMRVGAYWNDCHHHDPVLDKNPNKRSNDDQPSQQQHQFTFTNDNTNPFNVNGLVVHTYAISVTEVLMNHVAIKMKGQGLSVHNIDLDMHDDLDNCGGDGGAIIIEAGDEEPTPSTHLEILTAIASSHPDLYNKLIEAATATTNQNKSMRAEEGEEQHPTAPNKDDNNVILIEVSVVARPVLTMSQESTSINTISEQRFVVYNPTSIIPYQLLFTIGTNSTTSLTMNIQYDPIVDTFVLVPFVKKMTSAFSLTYSLVGPIPLDLLNIVLESITTTILLPLMNQQLFKGVDLPSPPDFSLVHPELAVPAEGGFLLVKAGFIYRGSTGNNSN